MFHLSNRAKRILAGILVFALIITMVLSLVISVRAASPTDSIVRNGIKVDGESVSGLTGTQLTEKINGIVDSKKNATITFHGKEEGDAVSVSAGNLGMKWVNEDMVHDILNYGHGSNIICRYKEEKDLEKNGADYDVTLDFSEDKILAFLQNNCADFSRGATNATLHRENGVFSIEGGAPGYVLDEAESVKKIHEFLTTEWSGGDIDLDLVIDEQEPKGSAEELAKVTDKLGSFTTYYGTSNAGRKQNIANAVEKINGITLYPGETFSVLQHITPFTEENGYALAGSYSGDEVVESLGGGICQVSTTLYNAVIRAELQVTERYNHSLIVGYVDPSDDAAIAESSNMDIKFVNTLDHPIYLAGAADGGTLLCNIYGVEERDPSRSVSFVSETLKTIPSEGIRIKKDAAKPVGYINDVAGHTGYEAQLWKVVNQGGSEISREVFNKSTYQMSPRVVTVGTAGNLTEELQAAIDSEDVAAIRTAAENAKNGVSAEASSDAANQAQQAAQSAYEAALAEGLDPTTAMERAQEAANNAVGITENVEQPAEAEPVETGNEEGGEE